MGCKQSELRDDGEPINPEHLPKVPLQSWYAQPFSEASSMPFTPFHDRNKGRVIFSNRLIPTRRSELEALGDGLTPMRHFTLGHDPVYGMGYLHNSALHIEHTWRLRVSHDGSANKFERPFFDMLLGIKLFVNDLLVPDSMPHDESLPQCTATYKAHEACTQWRCVPVTLWPEQDSVMFQCPIYHGLIYSFLQAVLTLDVGEHDLRVEVVYGCRNENNFCTDFVSRGGMTVIVQSDTKEKAEHKLHALSGLMQKNAGPVRAIENPRELCAYCGVAKRYICNTCNARICGSAKCVWSAFLGYPYGCLSHPTQS